MPKLQQIHGISMTFPNKGQPYLRWQHGSRILWSVIISTSWKSSQTGLMGVLHQKWQLSQSIWKWSTIHISSCILVMQILFFEREIEMSQRPPLMIAVDKDIFWWASIFDTHIYQKPIWCHSIGFRTKYLSQAFP